MERLSPLHYISPFFHGCLRVLSPCHQLSSAKYTINDDASHIEVSLISWSQKRRWSLIWKCWYFFLPSYKNKLLSKKVILIYHGCQTWTGAIQPLSLSSPLSLFSLFVSASSSFFGIATFVFKGTLTSIFFLSLQFFCAIAWLLSTAQKKTNMFVSFFCCLQKMKEKVKIFIKILEN